MNESDVAAMREALEYALLAHANKGRARPCDCSLCEMIRKALSSEAGRSYAQRLRQECIDVVQFKVDTLRKHPEEAAQLKAVHVAREICEMLKGMVVKY